MTPPLSPADTDWMTLARTVVPAPSTPPAPRRYGPEEARADADERGYHTPGSLRVLLGLHRWELEEGRREGLVPAPDANVGRYERWSVVAAERMVESGVAGDVRRLGPSCPPMGRTKAAAYIQGWRGGGFTPEDVDSLVELGDLAQCGEYLGHPLYDQRDLDGIGPKEADRAQARTVRRRLERTLLHTAACCHRLGIRVSDWRHVVARGWIEPVEHRPGRWRGLEFPLYSAADVEDLLLREDVDWNAVRAAPKGARSPLLDVRA